MPGFIRNLILLVVMTWITLVLAWWSGLDGLALNLPADWPYALTHALAVNLPLAAGVLASSFAFSFLVKSRRPVWWVAALGVVVALLAMLSQVTWVHGLEQQQLEFGPGLLWGPLAIALATLTGMRLASAINRRRRGRRTST